jgi:hypothetical protein
LHLSLTSVTGVPNTDYVGCEITHGSSKKTSNIRIIGTSRRVRVPTVVVKKRKVLYILSVCL